MEKLSILIADDDSDHLETVFDTVNIYDPILPNDTFSDDSYIVKGHFSAGNLPFSLSGHAEVQCVSSINSANKLFKNNESFDICITDINFSSGDADGPSIATACGASQENKLLYTSREEVEPIYEERGNWITSMEEFTSVRKENTKVIKYFSQDRDEIVHTFLMNAELRISEKKINSAPQSRSAESSWKKFRKSLDALLSEDGPRHDKLKECEERLTSDLRDAVIAGTRFRHLFPFRYSFLVRRLMEARRILDGDADQTYPSWREVKLGIGKKSDQIDNLILSTENSHTTRQRSDEKEASGKLTPKKITLDLTSDDSASVLVETKNGSNFELDEITNAGVFLLLAVKLRNGDENQIDGPVRREYDNWSPPLIASSLLLNKFQSLRRGAYSKFLKLVAYEKEFGIGKDIYKAKQITQDSIKSENIFKSIFDEERSWEEIKSEEGEKRFTRKQIGTYDESKGLVSPDKGSNHKDNVTSGTPKKIRPVIDIQGKYIFPEYVESVVVNPTSEKRKDIEDNLF